MLPFEEGEYVIHVAHKHWFVFLLQSLLMSVVAALPLIILPVLSAFYSLDSGYVVDLFTFIYGIYLIFVWIIVFIMWTDYYLDMAVITNKRIMDVEQKGLFSRVVSTLRYEVIQDVTTDIVGVVPTLLNYGDLYVQTAAEKREFCIEDVKDPVLVKSIISGEMSKSRYPI